MPIETMARGLTPAKRLVLGGTYSAQEALKRDKVFSDFIESREGQTVFNDQAGGYFDILFDNAVAGDSSPENVENLLNATNLEIAKPVGLNSYAISLNGLPSVKEMLGIPADKKLTDVELSKALNNLPAQDPVAFIKERFKKEAALAVQEGRFKVRIVGGTEVRNGITFRTNPQEKVKGFYNS